MTVRVEREGSTNTSGFLASVVAVRVSTEESEAIKGLERVTVVCVTTEGSTDTTGVPLSVVVVVVVCVEAEGRVTGSDLDSVVVVCVDSEDAMTGSDFDSVTVVCVNSEEVIMGSDFVSVTVVRVDSEEEMTGSDLDSVVVMTDESEARAGSDQSFLADFVLLLVSGGLSLLFEGVAFALLATDDFEKGVVFAGEGGRALFLIVPLFIAAELVEGFFCIVVFVFKTFKCVREEGGDF